MAALLALIQEQCQENVATLYSHLTKEKISEVLKLLSCGDCRNGFRKHMCPECDTVLMVPFTCKSRLCLSCHRKKLYGWSMNLSAVMHTTLAHIHVTFTLPGPVIRSLFKTRFPCEDLITAAAGVFWKDLSQNSLLMDECSNSAIQKKWHSIRR